MSMSQNQRVGAKKVMQDTINFTISSTEISQALENEGEYKLSIKREFRTLRSMKLIMYTPISSLSDQYVFKCVRHKKTTYKNLLNEFELAIEEVKIKDNPNSEIYKVREILKAHNGQTV